MTDEGGWGMGKEAGSSHTSTHLGVELVADDADEGSGDLGEEGLEGLAAAVHGQLTQGGGAHLTHVLTAVHEAVLVQRHQGSQTSGDGEGCMGVHGGVGGVGGRVRYTAEEESG
jgi:hypothetical protein